MPSKKEPEISRHALFERVERRYEKDVVKRLLKALDVVDPPPGWYSTSPRGKKETFDWRAMTVLLTLMFYWGFTFWEMSAHLEHDQWLLSALGRPRASANSTL